MAGWRATPPRPSPHPRNMQGRPFWPYLGLDASSVAQLAVGVVAVCRLAGSGAIEDGRSYRQPLADARRDRRRQIQTVASRAVALVRPSPPSPSGDYRDDGFGPRVGGWRGVGARSGGVVGFGLARG